MKTTFLLSAVAAITSMAAAFTIPQNLTDGAYYVDVDENGKEVAVPLSMDLTTPSAVSRIFARTPLPNGKIDCTGAGVQFDDVTISLSQLYQYCGTGTLLQNKKTFFQSGNAYAYVCNYGGTNYCSSAEAQASAVQLEATCGNPSAMTGANYWLADWAKSYGYDAASRVLCGNLS